MVSLLLADRVVTLLPSPMGPASAAFSRSTASATHASASGTDHGAGAGVGETGGVGGVGDEGDSPTRSRRARAEALAAELPRYRAFMRSWEWLVPLWQRGVVRGELAGLSPVDDAREACRVLTRHGGMGRYAPLASLMRPDLFDDEAHYLDTLAHDLNRAGPDPGVTVPVHAGLDWFAIRAAAAARARAAADGCGTASDASLTPILVARPEPASVAQQAETRLALPVVAFAMPMLVRAGARTILMARDHLQGPLAALRGAIGAAADGLALDESALPALTRGAREYASAFQDVRTRLIDEDECDDNDVEMMEGTAKVSIVSLPADAVLESSLIAMQRMMPVMQGGAGGGGCGGGGGADQPQALAHRTPHAGARVLAAVVKVLGRGR